MSRPQRLAAVDRRAAVGGDADRLRALAHHGPVRVHRARLGTVATSGGERDRRGAHRGFGGGVCAEQPQQNHGRVGRFSPAGPWLVGDRLRFAAVHGLSRAWLSGPSP